MWRQRLRAKRIRERAVRKLLDRPPEPRAELVPEPRQPAGS
jgi:hypothetical protein